MILRRSLDGVLGQLANEGLLTDAQLEPARAAAANRPEATPWFVRVLVGAGAWVASLLVLVFCGMAKLLDGAASQLVLGTLFYGGAVALRRLGRGDFAQQLSLSFGLAGAAMLVFALADGVGSEKYVAVLLAALCIAVVTVVAFPDVVMRFLATLAASVSLVLFFHQVELGPDGAVLVVGVLAGLTWHFEPRLLAHPLTRPLQRPVAWGLLISFLGAMLTTLIQQNELRVGPLASVAATVALLVLLVAIAVEHRASLVGEPVVVALLVAVVLGAIMFRAPGVVAALYAMLLAFHRRSPVMLGLAMVFLVTFGTFFYLSLELTLLRRGAVLLGSGGVMLALRAYVRWRFGPIVEEELP
jgi:hypothetical protein